MKLRKLQLLIISLAIFSSMMLYSACGDDDDDNDDADADDDTDDDVDDDVDDDIDDDTDDDVNDDVDDDVDDDADDDADDDELTISNPVVGDCIGNVNDVTQSPYDIVEFEWVDDILKVSHKLAIKNEGYEFDTKAFLSGDIITIREYNSGELVDSICPRDITYEITDLESDVIYQLRLYDMMDTESKDEAEALLADLELWLLDQEHYKWAVPLTDAFTFSPGLDPGPFNAGEEIQINISTCYLEDNDSVQISHRIGYGKLGYPLNNIYFNIHEQLDLGNPGQRDPQCVFNTYTLPGLSADTYSVYGNARDPQTDEPYFVISREDAFEVQ